MTFYNNNNYYYDNDENKSLSLALFICKSLALALSTKYLTISL